VGAGHAGGGLAEPAHVVRPLADPLEVHRGSPVTGADLGNGACDGIPHPI
jgi:hypothetical protein